MNDSDSQQKTDGAAQQVDLQSLADFGFAPQWAKAKPGAHFEEPARQANRSFDRASEARRSADRAPRSTDRARRPAPSAGRRTGQQDEHRSSSPPRPGRRMETAPRPVETSSARREAPPPPTPFAGKITLLPNQKALKTLIRKLLGSGRCHPLTDICRLFLDRPDYCDFKIEVVKEEPATHLFQCDLCGAVATSSKQVEDHARRIHFDDCFAAETIQTDPPAGAFSCIARCGLSGRLLGPPNHHSYTEAIRIVHQTLYPSLSMEDYTRRIETLHDAELVEKWREESRTKQQYRLQDKYKGENREEAPLMGRSEAETWFGEHILPNIVRSARRVVMPGSRIRDLQDSGLAHAVQSVFRRETAVPASLKFALRGAFHANKLHVWKSPKGTAFVSSVAPAPLALDHVVDTVRELLVYIGDHPRCSRQDILAALRPDLDAVGETAREFLAPLVWLIEKGHVLHFADATLCLAPQARS